MILIFDAYNMLFAGYHVFSRQLQNTPPDVAALYGFFRMLLARVGAYITFQQVFVVFDQGRSPWRLALWPEYKGLRTPAADDKKALEDQALRDAVMRAIEELYAMRAYLPWYTLRLPNTEADDLIAGLCRVYANTPKIITTSDKDMIQLVRYPHTAVYSPVKGIEINSNPAVWPECVKVWSGDKKKCWSPLIENYTDYRAFIGETGKSSDNIPGVPGWGEITAARVFSMTSVDPLIERLRDNPEGVLQQAEVPTWKSVGKKTRENWHIYERNRQLVDLFTAPDHLPTNWMDQVHVPQTPWFPDGRNHFWQWLTARVFASIQKKFDNFDMMATRIWRQSHGNPAPQQNQVQAQQRTLFGSPFAGHA